MSDKWTRAAKEFFKKAIEFFKKAIHADGDFGVTDCEGILRKYFPESKPKVPMVMLKEAISTCDANYDQSIKSLCERWGFIVEE